MQRAAMNTHAMNTHVGWTTDAQLGWPRVGAFGVTNAAWAVYHGHTLRSDGILDGILRRGVISTLEHMYPGTVKPWVGVSPPQYPVYLGLYKEKPTGEYTEFKVRVEEGLFVFTAPLRSPAIARLHGGDSGYYLRVCSDGWIWRWLCGIREQRNTIHYTYRGGERRRFNVKYTFRGAAKHLEFRCNCEVHFAVFMDAVLGTDLAATVLDKRDQPEKYAPAFTRRVRARTATTADVV